MSTTDSPTDEASPIGTDAPTATSYVEEKDWVDRVVGFVRARPWVGIIAGVVVVALITVGIHAANQPIGTDPTVAGRPLSNPDQHLHTLAIDPVHPGIIYLGSHYGLFTSMDDGKSWPQGHGALHTLMITYLATSPLGQGVIGVVGIDPGGGNFGSNGIFLTQDGGKHWTRAKDPAGMPIDTQRYLVVPGTRAHQWYAVYTGFGLYRSDDEGQSWHLLHAAVAREAQHVLWLNPANPQQLLLGTTSGLQLSLDAGATWANVAGVTGGVYSIQSSPASTQGVYVSGERGVFHSADGGRTFTQVSGNVTDATFARLAVSAQHATVLYGLVGHQVWGSHDGGGTWQQLVTLQTSSPSALLVAPDNDQHLYVGFYSPAIVIESLDGGKTWRQIAS